MASKKNKKRQHSRTVDLKRQQEQEKLAEEKERSKQRLDPTARMLLYGDLVFLAIISLLDYRDLISDLAGGLCTIVGIILLLAALWFQFGNKVKKGPRL